MEIKNTSIQINTCREAKFVKKDIFRRDQMHQQQALPILDLIGTTQDAAIQLIDCCQNADLYGFTTLSGDISSVYQSIMPIIEAECSVKTLYFACESIVDSLNRVVELNLSDQISCAHKIEFELLPLMQIFYMNFYFYEIASKDEENLKRYLESERFLLGANTYIDQAKETGDYKYELSIIVTGYNKLDYTKKCVQSLLKFIPKDLNYELILLNNGSTDDTKEYFESIRPHKQVDVFRNGGGPGVVSKIIEGKYSLGISNDVLVTENAIQNMLACIKSDPSIVYVVPTTPNVSNLQTISEDFQNTEEMYLFAKNNNRQNPLKWEQRTRLCNPIAIYSSKDMYSSKGLLPHTYVMSEDWILFPDDKQSFIFRQNGLKMMLAKDAYCYHYGSVTIKDQVKDNEYYSNGRKIFQKTFGIDPWGKGFCYDNTLFKELSLAKKDNATILGISPGMGSNPLKFKTLLRELGSKETKLYLTTEEEHFLPDYETYTDPEYICITEPRNFTTVFPDETFDYITVETKISIAEGAALKKRLKSGGLLIINATGAKMLEMLKRTSPTKVVDCRSHRWYVFTNK